MADIVPSIFRGIADLSPVVRHLAFAGWAISWALVGTAIFYGIPAILGGTKEADEVKPPPPPAVQQTITIAGHDIGLPLERSGAPQAAAVIPESVRPPEKIEANASTNNVIAPRNITGGITIHVSGGTNIIQVGGDLSVTEQAYKLTNDTGGEIEINVYLLFNSAAWSSGSSSKLITYKDKEVTLDDFLEGEKFASHLNTFQAIVCLGLASGKGSTFRNLGLADERAVHLCGIVSRKVATIKKDIAVYGLPLGYNKNAGVKERAQRSIVILGVQSASGTLTKEAEQRRVIACALKENLVNEFKFSDYSELAPGKLLRYIKINRGTYTQNCGH